MAAIFPPQFRDVGPRLPVTWTAGAYTSAGPTKATIHGSPDATFTSAGAGEETISIGRGAGAPIVVSAGGGEASIGDWITTINTAIGGAAVAAVDAFGSRLRLGDAARIRVTAYGGIGGAAAAFAVLGLPIDDRDAGAGAQASIAINPSANVQQISDPVAVPPGANFVTVWFRLFAASASIFEAQLAVAFDNGTEGVPVVAADAISGIFDLAIPPLVHNRAAPADLDRLVDTDLFRVGAISTNNPLLLWTPLEYRIPAGATSLRVIALSNEGAGGVGSPAAEIPSLVATVTFAAR